ncbi:MAG: hypothetical protein NVSMB70_01380 [Chamaesiphon sp.]
MIIFEFKVKGKEAQYRAIDEAIRTGQFIRNKCLDLWLNNRKSTKYDLNKYCATIAAEYPFANELNSMARQASAERAWSGIGRFYDNCRNKKPGKKGFPRFKKNSRSIEYKTSGWKFTPGKKEIAFTDGKNIGKLKLKGTWDLAFYSVKQIKRVRLVRRADGYYCQFGIDIPPVELKTKPTGRAIGLDVGLKYFVADSEGNVEPAPQFYRKAERNLNRANRKKSRKYKKGEKQQSKSYVKARNRYARKHLKVSRQREEYVKGVAYRIIQSNDLVAYEDLNVKGMVKHRRLAKSISDASWSRFREWLEYFGGKYSKVTVAVPAYNTSQKCSNCDSIVKKSLSTRTHNCKECGCCEDRDVNAAINILRLGLSTAGHAGNYAGGELPSWAVGENLPFKGNSLNPESASL